MEALDKFKAAQRAGGTYFAPLQNPDEGRTYATRPSFENGSAPLFATSSSTAIGSWRRR
jgi:hypothetical protein